MNKIKRIFTLMARVMLITMGLTAALSAPRDTPTILKPGLKAYKVAATTTIYKGGMVCLNATGFALPAADNATYSKVIGVADETVVNSGSDGAKLIRVRSGEIYDFDASSINQAMVGTTMYVVDDHTVDETTSHDVIAGVLVECVSATRGKVHIPSPGHTPAGTINTAAIENLAVTAAKLAADAVETAKIENLAVTAAKLAANAVETAKIADGAVTSVKQKVSITTKNDDAVLTPAEAGVIVVTADDKTITLPAADGNAGLRYGIKVTASHTSGVAVTGNAAEEIDGAGTLTSGAQYSVLDIVCDGTGWHVIGKSGTWA